MTDRVREMCRLRDEGRLSVNAIAARLGVSRQAVSQVLNRHRPGSTTGANRLRPPRRVYVPGAVVCGCEVVRTDGSGPGADVFLRCPCGQVMVRVISAVNTKARDGGVIRCDACRAAARQEKWKADPAGVAADYAAGLTWKALGKKYGLSPRGVRLFLGRAGVELGHRTPWPARLATAGDS